MDTKTKALLKEAKDYEQKSLFWEAGEKYQETLLSLNKTGGSEDKKSLCKKKIRKMNICKAKSFLQDPFEIKLTTEERNKLKRIANVKNINKLLDEIGRHPVFLPLFQEIKKEAENKQPIALSITNFDTQDKNGDLLEKGHSARDLYFSIIYKREQDKISYLYLSQLFDEIMDERLNIQNFSNYFRQKGIFHENSLKILDAAIKRFFEGDYISTLHILVPKFEKVFLDLTRSIGNIDTIASRLQKREKDKIWTRDRILGEDFLENENVRRIWGEDLCEQIIFVFFSQLGYKLRHKIAHGYAALGELNFYNSVLVLYFYLVLSARVKRIKEDS